MVFGISDEGKGRVKAYLKKQNFTFPTLDDSGRRAHSAYRVHAIPSTFVINREGVVAKHFRGGRNEKQLLAGLRAAGLKLSVEAPTKLSIRSKVQEKGGNYVRSVPQLLAPTNNASIPQNNPDIGCPSNPRRGYGWAILFDWTDSPSPTGIAGYEIYARKRDALDPIVNTFVTISQYYYKSCNSFTNDHFLTNWEWRVRAKDNAGNFGDWTPSAVFQLSPCRLEDGTSCRG